MKKKVLVLGSGGQIGNHLIKCLTDYDVIEFDIVNNINQDLRNYSISESYIKDCDFIMFLAFDVGGSYYLDKYQNTFEFINNNISIMKNTFELIEKYNKPFIFTSSQMSNMIDSSYGVLKLIGEYYTKSLKGIYVKFWNVYGIETDYTKSHVITDFIRMAKTDRVIKMRTNGEEDREFLHADDASKCLIKILENYDIIDRNKEIHISSFIKTKIIDIANIVSKFIPSEIIPSERIDNIQFNRSNISNKYILDIWKPEIDIIDGIESMVKYYINN